MKVLCLRFQDGSAATPSSAGNQSEQILGIQLDDCNDGNRRCLRGRQCHPAELGRGNRGVD
jgi:hypothetical protein